MKMTNNNCNKNLDYNIIFMNAMFEIFFIKIVRKKK